MGGLCPPIGDCAAALQNFCGDAKGTDACSNCTHQHERELDHAGCGWRDVWHFCPSGCKAAKPGEEWKCWDENIGIKTGGQWQSFRKEGRCNVNSPMGSCGWRVLSTKTVNESCLRDSLITTVESTSPDCFKACGARNETSPCWIGCFFDTILGPDAAHASGYDIVKGMPLDHLERGWTKAFQPAKDGGCAKITLDSMHEILQDKALIV